MVQLPLFPDIVKSAYLRVQDSPRDTYYRIWIEEHTGGFMVCKESGSKGKVLDRRQWSAESYAKAETLFDRRIKSKTNPDRKSPRKYIRVGELVR